MFYIIVLYRGIMSLILYTANCQGQILQVATCSAYSYNDDAHQMKVAKMFYLVEICSKVSCPVPWQLLQDTFVKVY